MSAYMTRRNVRSDTGRDQVVDVVVELGLCESKLSFECRNVGGITTATP